MHIMSPHASATPQIDIESALAALPSFNEPVIRSLKSAFKDSSLSSRIVCLIVHGSSLYRPLNENPNADIDLELVLCEAAEGDAFAIRALVCQSPIKVECQYRYLCEITTQEGLLRRSQYNLFSFFAYRNSICLLGSNIYTALAHSLSSDEVRQSLVISTQLAFKNIRKLYLAQAANYEVNKMTLRFLHFLGMASGFINASEIGTEAHARSNGIFDAFKDNYQGRMPQVDIDHLAKFQACLSDGDFHAPMIEVCARICSIFENDMFHKKQP
jgi:hypothetical protein